jgi:mannose-6-phosphate isomerase-like protein (cupin superfamily)
MRVVHVDEVEPRVMRAEEGWAISEFRLPIGADEGSRSALFHARFRPGSEHARHVHRHSHELVAYLAGRGIIGQGRGRAEVAGGHRRWVPQGTEHFFFNDSQGDPVTLIGFYAHAGDVVGSGYEFCGAVTADDVAPPFPEPTEGSLMRVEQVTPLTARPPAWALATVRVAHATDTPAPHAFLDVEIGPGAGIASHRLRRCEQIYYVAGGRGTVRSEATEAPVREGHAVLVAEGEAIAIEADPDEALALVGLWTGATGFEDAAYEEEQANHP